MRALVPFGTVLLSCLAATTTPAQDSLPVLVVGGANNHDVKWTTPSLAEILTESGRFAVTVTTKPGEDLAAMDLTRFRTIVLDYNGPRWGEQADAAFLAAVRGGVGVTIIHAADNAFRGWVEYEKLVGLMWRKGTGHGRFHSFDVAVTDPHHPITAGMPDLRDHPDELYHRLVHMHDAPFRVLASAHSTRKSGGTGRYEPMIIVSEFGKGRVFHTPLGHVWRGNVPSRASHKDPQFRQLVCRGTEWAATGQVSLPAQPRNFLTAKEKEQGFELLFNGRDLNGWRGYRKEGLPAKGWSVAGAAIHHSAKGGGGDIITAEKFGNFDFRFEWKIADGANSGVIYRVAETQSNAYETGPEYQVLDNARRANPVHSAGALYDLVAPRGDHTKPAGQWNTGRILIDKGRVQHWVNGKQIVDAPIAGEEWKALIKNSKFAKWPEFGIHDQGHIALQDHGDAVWYRSLRILRLK